MNAVAGSALVLSIAGCSGSAPALPPVASLDLVAPAHAPAGFAADARAPARWFRGGGITVVGPKLAGGTLVLAGGRRMLVAADGSARLETVPTSEPLIAMTEVPDRNGRNHLVAHGDKLVYRFDDPLGAVVTLARVDGRIRSIGAGPGVVAIWEDTSESPRFVDIQTGAVAPLSALPELPVRALAFRNARQGAGLFAGAGLFVTTDGGATWRAATDTAKGDVLRVKGLRLRAGQVRAFVHASGRDAGVDLESGRLGAVEDAPAVASEPPLIQWIRKTGLDPLEAAVTSGVEASGGGALVASHGLLARVDTTTGAVTELVPFGGSANPPACIIGKAAQSAWAVCPLSAADGRGAVDPFGVLHVPLEAQTLKTDPAILVRDGEIELRTSPSGGVMLLGPCNHHEGGQACVRQPSGQWLTFSPETSLFDHGAGPLASGKIAIVRNLYPGDEPQGDDDFGQEPLRPDEPGAAVQQPYLALIDRTGREQRLAPLPWTTHHGDLRVQTPIEEGPDRVLRAVIEDEDGAYVIEQVPGQPGRLPRRIAGATQARMQHGRAIALGPGQILSSIDGGSSWQPAAASKKMRAHFDAIASAFDDPTVFSVTEVGAKIDTFLRIGWGSAEQTAGKPGPGPMLLPDPPADPAPLSVLAAPARPVGRTPPRVLSCTGESTIAGTPIPLLTSQTAELLQTKTPVKKGARRTTSTAPTGRTGVLETLALMEEEQPEKPGASAVTWTLRWMDPTEMSAKPRTLAAAAPKGAPAGARLISAASSGARALLTVRAGAKHFLVRAKLRGAAEIIPIEIEMLPSTPVVFGTDAGEPIAWIRDTSLIVWMLGEAPRVIGHVASLPDRVLGRPTKAGVPVWLSGESWSLLRYFPIPPLDKRDKSVPAPLPPSVDGWQRVAHAGRDLRHWPACGRKPGGAVVTLVQSFTPVQIDGLSATSPNAIYDVRVSPAETCVAQVTAVISPERQRSGAAAAPPAKPPAKEPTKGAAKKAVKAPAKKAAALPRGPVTFVRIDFAAKKAEGGTRGLSTKDAVRKMTCSLVEKP